MAFPLQQWLHEHSSMLRYTYITCLVIIKLVICTYEIHKTIHSRPPAFSGGQSPYSVKTNSV